MKDNEPQENHILEKNTRVTSDRSVLSRSKRFVLGLHKQTHVQNLVKGASWLSAVVHLLMPPPLNKKRTFPNFCPSCDRRGDRFLVHSVAYLTASNNQDFLEYLPPPSHRYVQDCKR